MRFRIGSVGDHNKMLVIVFKIITKYVLSSDCCVSDNVLLSLPVVPIVPEVQARQVGRGCETASPEVRRQRLRQHKRHATGRERSVCK